MTQHFKSHFGTDGIRGKVGESPITVDFVLRLGWAAGRVLASHGQSKVVIGKDTRISGYMLESALEAGLSAAGVDVYLLGPMPTPAIAHLTRVMKAEAGIVISASHNPYEDNGIKLFSHLGEKLSAEIERDIENHMALPIVTVSANQLGKAFRVNDADKQYKDFCYAQFPALDLSGLKIVLDCAHGATYHIAPTLFENMGAQVIAIGIAPNGRNINEQCGSTYPQTLQAAVKEHQADLGIAFDGDGDRVIMVDEKGEALDGDKLLYIMAQYLHAQGRIAGGVVGTQMSNLALEHAIADLGLQFERTKVGDKYVLAKLQETGWSLGGENSGHIIQMKRNSTGDGILAALQVLEAMRAQAMSLSQMQQQLILYPQIMINVPVKCQQDPMLHPEIEEAVKKAESQLKNRGRVLLRRSGTEPLVRVMVEGEDSALVANLAETLADVVKKKLVSDHQHSIIH